MKLNIYEIKEEAEYPKYIAGFGHKIKSNYMCIYLAAGNPDRLDYGKLISRGKVYLEGKLIYNKSKADSVETQMLTRAIRRSK